MEELYFANTEHFEEVEIAEEELVDAYVRNELSPTDRQLFEQKFNDSSRLRERVQFARTLAKSVNAIPLSQPVTPLPEHKTAPRESSAESVKKPRWRGLFAGSFAQQPFLATALAACAVIALIGGVILLASWLQLRQEVQRLATEQSTNRNREPTSAQQQSEIERLNAALAEERRQRAERERQLEELQRAQSANRSLERPTATTAFIVLTPGAMRGSARQHDLLIRPDTANVRLQLALDANDYPRYQAVIRTPERAEVWRRDGLKPRRTNSGHALDLKPPANRLKPGDYNIEVSGITPSGAVESVDNYSFRVLVR